MNIVIRADASIEIGTGHVMRCLTLAKQLLEKGAEITFVCRSFEGNSISFLRSENMKVIELPLEEKPAGDLKWMKENWQTDAEETLAALAAENIFADMLVVDHYSLDYRWEEKLRVAAKKIFVIDDLADRKHDCEFLLDQNFYLNMESRYDGLVPKDSVLLLGPEYVLLRDEFLKAAKHRRERTGRVENLFVFFGGADPSGETLKVLKALENTQLKYKNIDVVVGMSNPRKNQIKVLCEAMDNTNFYCQTKSIVQLMIKADLAIGAGGSVLWEQAILGLPAILYSTTERQKELIQDVSSQGSIISLDTNGKVNEKEIREVLQSTYNNRELIQDMQNKCYELINDQHIRQGTILRNSLILSNMSEGAGL